MADAFVNAMRIILSLVLLSLTAASPAAGGITDTPLPRFSDGQASTEVMGIPGVVKRTRLQTEFFCSSLAATTLNIGIEIFADDGTLLNDVGAGVGAALGVGPGQTVTIGTSSTLAFLESSVIPLAHVSQGYARIVATSSRVACTAVIVDDTVTPPTSLATLGAGVGLAAEPAPAIPLPHFSSGLTATHARQIPGVVKRGRMETVFICTSLASVPMDVGVQIFGVDGTLQNDVGQGNGAVLGVAPGRTVTIGTTGTAALLESTVIVLPGVAQGAARIVATSSEMRCNALMLDSDVSPPESMAAILTGAGLFDGAGQVVP